MRWVLAGFAWLLAGVLIAFVLGEVWASKTAHERLADDEAQIKALREYAEKNEDVIALKAKIPGGEA